MRQNWGPVAPYDQFSPADSLRHNVVGEERDRLQKYQKRWAYYQDNPPKMLRVRPGDMDDNVSFGYPRLIVDVGVSFLFGDEVGFQCEEEACLEVVNATWGDEERRMTTLNELGTNGGVCGEAFVKMSLGDDITPAGGPFVNLTVLDPGNVEVYWRPDDYKEVVGYRIEWAGYDPRMDQTISYRQDINPAEGGGWLIEDYRSVGNGGEMQTGIDVWPYDFPPVAQCQNMPAANQFYGESDLNEGVLHLIDRVNFSASNIAKILRYHAHPKVFAYGFPGKDVDFAPDKVTQVPNEQARVDILQMPSDLAAAYHFHATLVEALFQMARIPQIALGNLSQVGQLSSLSMKLAYQPISEKTDTKREMYGALINEINRRILHVAGFPEGDEYEVDVNWPSVVPQDPVGEAQEAMVLSQLGVSKRTLIQRLGFDADTEMQQNDEEGEAAIEQAQRQMAAGRPPGGGGYGA